MSSSRGGHRRRDRSWERDDRDRDRDRDRARDRERYEGGRGGARAYRDEKRRSSRSRSPRREDKDKDRERDSGRRDRRDRDYRRDDDRKVGDRDRRDDRRRDRDDRKEPMRREDKVASSREEKQSRDVEMKEAAGSRAASSHPEPPNGSLTSSARPSVDPKTPEHIHEDGEAVDDDDAGMMAAMGLAGFGSTKGKRVEGNQEGATDVKKIRTWRQYMNRRGGFNRPLDKIK